MSTQPITPEQAYEWLKNEKAVMIDVREPEEFQAERIAGTTSLPLSGFAESIQGMSFSKDHKIIFQCLKGGRSMQACTYVQDGILKDHSIFNLTGGITGWKESNLPVISGAEKKSGFSGWRALTTLLKKLPWHK